MKGPCVSVKVSSSTKECSFKNARAVAGEAALADAVFPYILQIILKKGIKYINSKFSTCPLDY